MTICSTELQIQGVPVSPGIALGRLFFLSSADDETFEVEIPCIDIEAEIFLFQRSIHHAKEEIIQLQRRLEQEQVFEGVAIFETHLQIIQDPMLSHQVEEAIRNDCATAYQTFEKIIKEYESRFNRIANPFFRERFRDVRDIAHRVLTCLGKMHQSPLGQFPGNSIVAAQDLTVSEIAEANPGSILAFISEKGGETSHAAIMAKARGIAYVVNIPLVLLEEFEGADLIVDGDTGLVILNPSEVTQEKYRRRLAKDQQDAIAVGQACSLIAETYDGYRIRLSANVEMVNEVDLLHRFGGCGVGLFRSEYLFLSQENFPGEEEQYLLYKTLVEKMRGLPIVIRTFDIGGDKQFSSYPIDPVANPFLGCRAIRFLLREREVFKKQLRAILRSSTFGEVSIMFPMVSSLPELLEAKSLLNEARRELLSQGFAISCSIRVGCMIEVPSAAIIADLLAKECDFLSIGTNDLVQYALAVDRSNQMISDLYAPTHPSVIRLIKYIIAAANTQGIPVTLCGEVAADPRFTPLLLGLGIHELSVASRHIPLVKEAVRKASFVSSVALAEKALGLSTAAEVQQLLNP